MGLPPEHYEALKTAAHRFYTEKDFNFPQLEDAMTAAFGPDRTSPEAQGWKAYWSTLGSAEEAGQEICSLLSL
ncbi:hypothetical protein B0H10DRAFT_2238278 [Mycena sp. CBHHK59/15]|nr:hypothetical protein B0H10DRAFT_2238278 [Mycena sp. CBHHK59/15]